MMMKLNNAITDIPGLRVGHAQDLEAITGCTVILCDKKTVGGIDKRGGGPSSRQTDQLETIRLVNEVHAILLAGGSAFGLDAASGVVRYLEERGIGFDMRVARVPIVPTAILFDLGIGKKEVRPDSAMGYEACVNAVEGQVLEGNVGAGCGATVGKILGGGQAMKAGLGTASIEIANGLIVGALVAVNAFGDVINPDSGKIIAGARAFPVEAGTSAEALEFADTLDVLRIFTSQGMPRFGRPTNEGQGNTVIGVVATNARLTKEETTKVAQMAHDGLARTVRPAHTMFDGDTIFALSTGELYGEVNVIGAFAAEVFSQAILRAVQSATSAGGLPGLADLK
jgi:L-aminopeptidase/D-esterase-like protein